MTAVQLTALLPVKDYHPPYLREAVDSLLQQTSDQWQLVIVTEASGAARVAQVLEERLADARIRLIPNKGRGLGGAFNSGLRSVRTEFAAILLGDDRWAQDAVEILLRHIRRHPEADFFHSARRVIGEHGEPLSSVHLSPARVSAQDFCCGSPVKHLLCWRTSKALSIGGMDEQFGPAGVDDFDFPWSMAEAGAVFRAVPECLYLYRDHRSCFRLSTHVPLSIQMGENWRIMRKHGVDRLSVARYVWRARRGYLRQCLYRNEWERRFRHAFRLAPRTPWRQTYE